MSELVRGNRTAVPGAVDITAGNWHATLGPDWRGMLEAAMDARGVRKNADFLRQAVAAHPDVGRPEALRLYIANTFFLKFVEDQQRNMQIPMLPYQWGAA